jgi:hypothetical protein
VALAKVIGVRETKFTSEDKKIAKTSVTKSKHNKLTFIVSE